MASFSFGAGNAAKLVRMPLYAAGRIITLLVPRARDEWVFGCGAGIGDGALELWALAAPDAARAVWLVSGPDEARDAATHGIPALPKHSLRGFWRTARAQVVVVTHGFGDVNRYAVSGAFVVQLWHGVPLKRIGVDAPETVRPPALLRRRPFERPARRLLRMLYLGAQRRIDLLPAASHLVRGRLESAFGLDDGRVPVTGEPRVDVLSRGTAADRRTLARAAVARASGVLDQSARLALYAPTWRDGDDDPAIPTRADWAALQEVLQRHDTVLFVRSHPLGAGEYAPPEAAHRVRMLGSDVAPDVTPLLPAFDVLITDYSSLAYDSALVPMPVVYLAPDVAAYSRRRGFYGCYRDVAGDDRAQAWPGKGGAIAQLDEVLGDAEENERRVERARALSRSVHDFRDGENTRRVYRAIRTELGRRHRRAGGGAR